ncbi:protein LAZ1 [Tanacetum coccineum]
MLDALTSSMCDEPLGRIGYARALIEVSAGKEFKKEVIMAVLIIDSEGYTKERMNVEFEWKPSRCTDCNVFGHANNECSKRVVESDKETVEIQDDGFKTNQTKQAKPKSNGDEAFSMQLKNKFTTLRDDDDVFASNDKGASSSGKNGCNTLESPDTDCQYSNRCRIILGWDKDVVDVLVVAQSDQAIHSKITHKVDNKIIFYTFVYAGVVSDQWSCHVTGHYMYQVVQKMKALKKPFRKLLHDQGNLHARVNHLRDELDEVKKALDRDPSNSGLKDEEVVYFQAFSEAKLDEEQFLPDNVEVTSNLIPNVFVSHYMAFLGTDMTCDEFDSDGLFVKKVSDLSNENMIKPVTNDEIKRAVLGIRDNKAPGPEGFTSVFFKKSWDVVGQDVCNAVRDFFVNGKLLKEINHTFLALILKIATPLKVTDYRPISCCNVIYKCISKILTNRIIEGIKEVVIDNQSAFVPGRRILDNILLTQKLIHNYHLDRGPPRCAFKVYIQKAYDTVDWCFLDRILTCFGFHPSMIKWIMACVTSTSFSLSINGDIHGFFKGKRGLRQSDPLSSYLFTLVMEILTLILKRRGDVESAKVIMDSLNEFKAISGLVPSIPKSTVFFCNVLKYIKIGILNIMPFSEGKLPVKYLGVPLISSRLLHRDCKILVEKVRNKIGDWKNKSLSFAGRLQLCNSVISSMQVYWASVLVLPKGIVYDIQQLIRCFLWCNGDFKRGKAKVTWEVISLPKQEGGLGI